LKGNLYKPEGNGQFPAVVVLHGCAGIDYHFRAWAEQLKKWGYVALIVDSFSPRGVDRVCGQSYRVPDLERAADAYGAATYLKQLPYVDSDKIGLMGFSHGGWTGLRAVQKNFPYRSIWKRYHSRQRFYFIHRVIMHKTNTLHPHLDIDWL
jgi:dienelactone hydrolase